jgi:hypothetical protein
MAETKSLSTPMTLHGFGFSHLAATQKQRRNPALANPWSLATYRKKLFANQ